MAFVYIIGEKENEARYKIGATKKKHVEDRLRELQTGNSNNLYLKDSFETNYPFKLEAVLHLYFQRKKILNEWYELDEDDLNEFQSFCEQREKAFDALQDNPFFNKNAVPLDIDLLI